MGCVFFPVLSHVDLVDDVAGVAPVPSPSIGETWMEPLRIFIYEAFCFQGGQQTLLNPIPPPPKQLLAMWGELRNDILYSYV